ncbi:MAG: N-acetylmannosamine-6-phosphate 2-epimerase [Micrococcus sp.]|nr:N-acetylmannosamine-6-phosphate 2-epimerase [Micrococcus sp.]
MQPPLNLAQRLRGGLIVSCQAYPGEPLRTPATMARMAEAVVTGGACAVRVQGVDDIAATAQRVSVPIIGLWKDGDEGVYITPSVDHALACAEAGAHIVAVDATLRARPDGSAFADVVAPLHQRGVLVMADCDSLEAARAAHDAGADVLGTTLAGYTTARDATAGPDLALVREIRQALPQALVIAEGRIHAPDQASAARRAGADAVVVGTAITHPSTVTSWFVAALEHPTPGDGAPAWKS